MRVGCVGAGHIARALGQGWSRPEIPDPPQLTYLDVSAEAAARAAADTGASLAASLPELIEASDVVVVAVRPQHVAGVLAEAGPLLGDRPLVSVAAGVSLADLRAALPADARVARVMPNVAAALGLGVFLFVPGTLAERAAEVEGLFALAGDVVELDERTSTRRRRSPGACPGSSPCSCATSAAPRSGAASSRTWLAGSRSPASTAPPRSSPARATPTR